MYGALGTLVGKMIKGNIPAFEGLKNTDETKMKYLGAAMTASGSVALYYVKDKTPEWKLSEDYETIDIDEDMIHDTIKDMNTKEQKQKNKKKQLITLAETHWNTHLKHQFKHL